jgi:bromodomain and WD repeat domain-containing protein 1/3
MDKELYIIEPHPFKENIIFSADFDGNIILWDIELGIILNIFKEMAMPINLPNVDTPIVDGHFSPDGYSFCVSTFYGTFTLYGYGSKEIYKYSYYD